MMVFEALLGAYLVVAGGLGLIAGYHDAQERGHLPAFLLSLAALAAVFAWAT